MRSVLPTVLAAVLLISMPMAASGNQNETEDSAEPESAQRHVAAALLLAGSDFKPVAEGYLCQSPQSAAAFLAPYVVPLLDGTDTLRIFQAFDDLYYIGLSFVGTWVLRTNNGLILFDAMFNAQQATDVVIAGMLQLGLDPAELKHVIVTHAHGDHYGGARFLQREYGARIWLSEADWAYLENESNQAPIPPFTDIWPGAIPERDGIAMDGETLQWGGKSVQFVVTPGHTPGTLSAVISVDDAGTRRYVTLWGGTAMPQGSAAVREMHASLLKLWRAGQDAGAEGVISTHAFVEDSFGRSVKESSSGTNPFNLGHDGFNRMLAIHSECILAQAARYEALGQ